MDAGGGTGGILQLLELAEEHPAELAFDLRARLGLSLGDLGTAVTWREATHLVGILLRDPQNWVCAARQGWKYPVSREWVVAAHTYDLHTRVNTKKGSKPKPYPNPFPETGSTRVGRTTRSTAEVKAVLAWMNPKETRG